MKLFTVKRKENCNVHVCRKVNITLFLLTWPYFSFTNIFPLFLTHSGPITKFMEGTDQYWHSQDDLIEDLRAVKSPLSIIMYA